ncbi:hypothetical protein EVAR_9496_1 [Eumeta japonica]|uniref:Uncharacterized protein n=1 Tax=Eumeta variegata TaxID=151549 RepID=A0A4C1U485_EUMVA|nr:hypothetical protein EVAR_9496_1 [Eumeta japonica]
MEWKRDRCVTSRTHRSIAPLYRSFRALARTLGSGGTRQFKMLLKELSTVSDTKDDTTDEKKIIPSLHVGEKPIIDVNSSGLGGRAAAARFGRRLAHVEYISSQGFMYLNCIAGFWVASDAPTLLLFPDS